MSFGPSFTGMPQESPRPIPNKANEPEPLAQALEHQTKVRYIGFSPLQNTDLAFAIHQAFPTLNQSQIGATIGFARNLSESASEESETLNKFNLLADEWYLATAAWSSVIKIANHPAYQKIIGMGEKALPLILRHLEQTRANWLWALYAITGEQPAHAGSNYRQAVEAWLDWGRNKGYL